MITKIALTPGEPAGIGPDLCVQLAQKPPTNTRLVAVCDENLLRDRARQLDLPLTINPFSKPVADAGQVGEIDVIDVKLKEAAIAGVLNRNNAGYVLETLRAATETVLQGKLDALVTGPVHKGIINEAGIPFTGHTEFLADYCHCDLTVMMLATKGLRVALATTHLPLAEVPGAITRELLRRVISILHGDLVARFGIAKPRILVCGLNPHAGEGGHLGREEIDLIEPVLKEFTDQGMDLIGPLPADTLFTPRHLGDADAVLSMFHDQGLPVLKFKGFGNAGNITLGLPIIRTSVDHGTALDLAGSGKADAGSLYYAIATAVGMVNLVKTR